MFVASSPGLTGSNESMKCYTDWTTMPQLTLSLMFHVKCGRELIVAWWINKVYHFVDFLENLVEASVFAIKFLIPMNFVLHAQPDPVTRIVLGSFYPKHLVL